MAIHLETDSQLRELKFQLQKGGARAFKVRTFERSHMKSNLGRRGGVDVNI